MPLSLLGTHRLAAVGEQGCQGVVLVGGDAKVGDLAAGTGKDLGTETKSEARWNGQVKNKTWAVRCPGNTYRTPPVRAL